MIRARTGGAESDQGNGPFVWLTCCWIVHSATWSAAHNRRFVAFLIALVIYRNRKLRYSRSTVRLVCTARQGYITTGPPRPLQNTETKKLSDACVLLHTIPNRRFSADLVSVRKWGICRRAIDRLASGFLGFDWPIVSLSGYKHPSTSAGILCCCSTRCTTFTRQHMRAENERCIQGSSTHSASKSAV